MVQPVLRALEHYRATAGLYPRSVSALRGTDLEAAGRDTAAIRATIDTIERNANPNFATWEYRSDDTSYRFIFDAGSDSVPGLSAVECSFRTAGNVTCGWTRRASASAAERTTYGGWGPGDTAAERHEVLLRAMVFVPIIVLAGAVFWRGERADMALPIVAAILNALVGGAELVLATGREDPPLLGIALFAIVTCVVWGSFAGVMLVKARQHKSVFLQAAGAVVGGVIGAASGSIAVVVLGMLCCL